MDIKDKVADANIARSKDKSISVSGTISKNSQQQAGHDMEVALNDAVAKGVVAGAQMADGYFSNPIQKTGTFAANTMAGYYDMNMITFNRSELTALYHSCWELRKGVDKVAEDMWARGVEIRDQEDPNKLKNLYTWFARQNSEMIYATEQARLFGGAVTLMMVDDGEKDLSKPLKLDRVKKGSRVNFYTTDRWYGVEQSTEKVDDFQDPAFGEPKFYNFQIDGVGESVKVHHTRVLRWVNKRSVRLVEVQLMGWGVSEVEAVLQDLMNYSNVKNSSASLVNKALVEIIKLQGLRSVMTGLAGGNAAASAVLSGQMAAINSFRSSNGVALLDASDDYQKHEMNFSGLSQLIDANRPIVAGAFNMPLFYLFGDLKTGVFNSEESPEARMYENFIGVRQNEMLYKNVRKLLILGAKVTGTELMEDFDFDFIPLYDRTEKAKQEELTSIKDAVIELMDAGVMTHESAFLELQSASKRTGFGLHLEDRDLELCRRADKAAEEEPQDEGGEDEARDEERKIATNTKRTDYNSLFEGGKK